MKIKSCKFYNFGNSKSIKVPGSKSHTIRALILAALCNGKTKIINPLISKDTLATARAIQSFGAKVEFFNEQNYCLVTGAANNFHLPSNKIDVENSGSLLYFLTPILATLCGRCLITGDISIQNRPVDHLIDALRQMGATAFCKKENSICPPFEFTGPINNNNTLITDGKLSQYISGFMIAATRLSGTTNIKLTTPQETPYLSMTKYWLDKYGVQSTISSDYKKISVTGPVNLKAQDVKIPSDWESVAFPLIASLIANESIIISDIDDSSTQGDEKIIEILKTFGAEINWDKDKKIIEVNNSLKGKSQEEKIQSYKILSTNYTLKMSTGLSFNDTVPVFGKTFFIDISSIPDAICALCVIACFVEGMTIFCNIDVCRKKETDRIKMMTEILSSLGANIKDKGKTLEIIGHSPYKIDKNQKVIKNKNFVLHGGKVNSYHDHRIAMSLACYGLFLENDFIEIIDAECCDISFPNFFNIMNNSLNANFQEI